MIPQTTTLDRYLGRNTIQGFLLVLSILVVLFSFTELMLQINATHKGTYRVPDAFFFVGLTIPKRIAELTPMAALLGSIMSLGLLADRHELTAMQVAGVSVQRISIAVLATNVLIILAAVIVAEYVAPPLDQYARMVRFQAIYGKNVLMSKGGFWVRQGRNFVHVGQTFAPGQAINIEVYVMDDSGRLKEFLYARKGTIQGRDWVLTDIDALAFEENTITMTHPSEHRLKDFLTHKQVAVLELPPDSLSLTDLHTFIRNLEQHGQNARSYSLAFWQKICQPVTTGIMALLSLSFIFGPIRTRDAWQRIFLGMLVGVLFYLGNQLIARAGLMADLPAPLVALAPVALVLVVALKLLRRAF
jgi:lipopolysaccharide export system permease protein